MDKFFIVHTQDREKRIRENDGITRTPAGIEGRNSKSNTHHRTGRCKLGDYHPRKHREQED